MCANDNMNCHTMKLARQKPCKPLLQAKQSFVIPLETSKPSHAVAWC
jgi:hypothetical protein